MVEKVQSGLHDVPHEIILIDNQCTDGCCHGIPRDILILRTERRLRTCQLMWFGFSHATGDVIVWYPLRHKDVVPELKPLIDVAAKTVAIVQPNVAREKKTLAVGRDKIGGRVHAKLAAVARTLPTSHLAANVLALQRDVYRRFVPYRSLLKNGLPLAWARRLLGIPIVTDTRSPGAVVPADSRRQVSAASRDGATSPRTRGSRNDPQRSASNSVDTGHGDSAVLHVPSLSPPFVSVIITVHNEGQEIRRTVDSVRRNTESDFEIIVVDDGSTDGCCQDLESDEIRVIRHSRRIGVAHSRHEATMAARGDVLAYMDGHQRVSRHCLDHCAKLALTRKAIVWPDVRNMNRMASTTAHGASMRICPKYGLITARWRLAAPASKLSKISTLSAPGYFIPREIYHRVSWIRGLRGWGASELAIALKAFFLEIDIFHTCGPIMWHRFKKKFHYSVSRHDHWKNHALVARVCFDDRTWSEFWLPHVFQKYMDRAMQRDLEADDVLAQHEAFLSEKRRPDREFWRGLLHVREPPAIHE